MKAALVIWVDIGPEDDALFNHWHSREHVQERVGCPGWLRGSRLKGVERPGRRDGLAQRLECSARLRAVLREIFDGGQRALVGHGRFLL